MRDGDDANLCHKLPEFALLDWSVGNARTGEWIDAMREGQRRDERVCRTMQENRQYIQQHVSLHMFSLALHYSPARMMLWLMVAQCGEVDCV